MKKNWKSALSLLFVLIFMLQIAGMTASADYDPSVTGDESLSLAVYIPAQDADGNEISARLDGDSVNFPEGQSLEMWLGGTPLSYDSVLTLRDLMDEDLSITPPAGYYVAEAYIYANELSYGDLPATLEGAAEYPSLSGTRVTLKKENFSDENDPWYFDSSRLSNLGSAYTLLLRLALLEKVEYVSVSYDCGEVYASVPGYENGPVGTSFTVQPMSESVPGKTFTGWQLTYDSGSVVDVSVGSQIQPYASCTLVAQWEDAEEESEPEPAPVDPAPVDPVPVDPQPVVPEHVHSWVETSVTPASCETDGVRYLTCSECNETMSETIPATGHSYTETVVAPTYEAEGYTEHVCSVCGASYRDNYQPKLEPVHEHSYSEAVTQEATCTEAGVRTYTCSCGDSYTEAIPALGHSYTEAVTKEASCTEKGVKTFTCSRCGDSYTEEIPMKDHDYETTVVEPTLSAEGYTLHKCRNCGYEYRDSVTRKKEIKTLPAALSASSWTRGSNTSVTVTVDYDYSKFDSLLIDGFKMTRDTDYTVRSGSTIVEISAGTLEKLNAGERELKLVFTDAESSAKLTIAEPAAPEKTALTVKPKDRSAEYTGENITANEFEIVSGSLRSGDSIRAEYAGGSVNVTNSATTSISKLSVVDASGKDVTADYSVSIQNGSVTVTPRRLSISGQNVQKTYDGKAFSLQNEYAGKISSDKLSGHAVSIGLDIYQNGARVAEAKESGSYDIMLTGFTVRDGSGSDVSSNYSLTSSLPAKLGTLTISGNPAAMTPITVTAKSQTWTYDGQAHDCKDYTLSANLSDGDTMSVSFDAGSSITDVGTVANKISTITIKDRNGSAVAFALNGQGSGKYNVTLADGTLKVDPFKLTLTAVSAEKTYDGTALKNDNVKATALISGHKFSVVRFAVTDSNGNLIKNGPVSVGTYTKKVTDVTIVDARGADVTKNYDISKVDGTLKILQGDGSSNTKSPKTGDENNLGLWIGLLAASALIVLGIVAYFYFKNRKGGAKAKAKKSNPIEKK